MKLLYVGSLYPEALVKELVGMHSHVDFPANSLQHALLDGLDDEMDDIKVISSSPLSPYPKIPKWQFAPFAFSHQEMKEGGAVAEQKDVYVGVLNLPFVRLLSRCWRIRRELKRSIACGERNVCLVYGLHTPYILAAWSLRKKLDRICVIVPDLPQYMSGKTNPIYRLAKQIDRGIIDHCIRDFHGFVLLSPHMAELLPVEGKDTVVVDGIYGGTPSELGEVEKEERKTILYTGDTAERCGMLDLIEAFRQIEGDDYQLWIRGYGTNLDDIRERIRDDRRITWFPPMSRTELLRLERRATVLVNPIRPSQSHTRYYFPSKTMEYLASGTPTVMYRLDCLSADYDAHIHYVPEETVASLRDTLVKVCEQPAETRAAFGRAAAEYIETVKTSKQQAAKVSRLLKQTSPAS